LEGRKEEKSAPDGPRPDGERRAELLFPSPVEICALAEGEVGEEEA